MLYNFFGDFRFVFNNVLGKIQDSFYGTYEVKQGKNKGSIVPRIPNQTEMVGSSTILKEEYSFLNKLPNDLIQSSLSNLYKGTKGFYKGGGYPKFKSRKDLNQSIDMKAGSRAKIKDNYITLPIPRTSSFDKEIYRIKFKKHKTKYSIPKDITSYSISKDNLGLYWGYNNI